ncbi:MAG: DNA-binding protein [Verrucomicrobia bacterium]|nr:DNA-binding protein [Verrucomicrobiota bacterium]
MDRPISRCVKVSATNYLVDAGPVVGLFNRKDQWHAWSASVLTVLDEPLATTETVWAEVCHLMRIDRPCLLAAIDAVQTGRLRLLPVWEQADRIATLLEKYPQMDAGDASLVVLSERLPKARIITTDVRDFSVYRRFRNEPLPLIHP